MSARFGKDLETHGVVRNDLNIIVLDHVIPAADEKTATGHKKVRDFVKKYHIQHFYDMGEGICHQVVYEKGFARPGGIIVGSDSHTCSYGAVGTFATGVDRTESAALILTGETWFRVPETIKITLKGRFSKGVSAKDLVLRIIGDIGADGANYMAVEFHGDIQNLTMDDRFTVANMGIEMGAKIAVFPVDSTTLDFFEAQNIAIDKKDIVWADAGAQYVRELAYDLSKLIPVVAAPPHR